MNARDYFPLGKAFGVAFCNRTNETEWLIGNMQACKHSLLIAPRRFGKSSLADKSIAASQLPVVSLNFNTCSSEQDVESLIRQGVGQLIASAVGPVEKVIHSIKSYVRHLTPSISFGAQLAKLELTINQHITPVVSIEESLILIEKLLAEKKRSAVMLFDEFQVVGLIAKGRGVEAAIRNAAQNMKHVSIIFSGSSRSLLQSMFENESRPLYKLCRKLRLQRIEQAHYVKHLNKAAKLTWKADLSEDVFNRIMTLSDRHPHYVNYLCDVLWTDCKKLPSIADVDRAWAQVIEEETSDANAEIMRLSMGQKKILKYIVNNAKDNLMSAEAAKILEMAASTVSSAMTVLTDKDIIEKREDGYSVINPVVRDLLSSSLAIHATT